MDRAEAEAIYESGRVVCVELILSLAAGVERHEDGLRRLEEQARQDSRTSSRPPSMDPPKTRAQRRAGGRAKGKELMRREGEGRGAGGQSGHRGGVVSCGPRIRWMRSSITTRMRVADADVGSILGSAGRAGGSVATRAPSCRQSA